MSCCTIFQVEKYQMDVMALNKGFDAENWSRHRWNNSTIAVWGKMHLAHWSISASQNVFAVQECTFVLDRRGRIHYRLLIFEIGFAARATLTKPSSGSSFVNGVQLRALCDNFCLTDTFFQNSSEDGCIKPVGNTKLWSFWSASRAASVRRWRTTEPDPTDVNAMEKLMHSALFSESHYQKLITEDASSKTEETIFLFCLISE